jgi:tetratricopeptide (TPR) repeat protein
VPALGVLLVVICTAWAAWQPERSERASDRALALVAQKKLGPAAAEADHARDVDPAAIRPLWVKASVAIAAGKPRKAETYFQRAVFDQPSNPEAWTRLAEFELYRMKRANQALSITSAALFLDPHSAPAQTVFFDARRALRGG